MENRALGRRQSIKYPLHIRRGLLRLYIAVSAPWIAFFGYRFLDALQHYDQHRASEAFWSLLVVPIGGPFLLLVLTWVFAAFRKKEHTASETIDARSSQSQPHANESSTDSRDAKSRPDYRQIGKALGRIFFEPDVWHEMGKLPNGLVASETALARVAIIKDGIRRLQADSVASEMLNGVDQYIAEAFAKREHATTAALAIRLYEQNVFPLTQLADIIARRLLDSGLTAVEITPLLEMVAEEAERLIKLATLIEKFGRSTPLSIQT
jgi:hypothetical protein